MTAENFVGLLNDGVMQIIDAPAHDAPKATA